MLCFSWACRGRHKAVRYTNAPVTVILDDLPRMRIQLAPRPILASPCSPTQEKAPPEPAGAGVCGATNYLLRRTCSSRPRAPMHNIAIVDGSGTAARVKPVKSKR